MIRLLARVLGLGAGAGPQATGTRQFTPRLEVLDGRTMPSVLGVGGVTMLRAEWPPPPVSVLGGRVDPGGASLGGGVTTDGSAAGGVIATGGAAGGIAERQGSAVGITAYGG